MDGTNKQINNVKNSLSNSENAVYNNTLKNPGLTLNDLAQAYNQTGDLSEVENIAKKGLGINNYIDDPQLESIKVNLNNALSTKQIQDLSEWTATLLNEFRQEVGIKSKVIATVGSAKISQEVSEGYNQSKNSGYNHNNDVLMDL